MYIHKFEPEIDRYYPKKSLSSTSTHTQTAQSTDSTQHNDDTNTNNQISKNIAKWADIAITIGSETIIIDVTTVEPSAQYIKYHNKAEAPANQRADFKMSEYKLTNIMDAPIHNNTTFYIASTTTQGSLGTQFTKLFKRLVNLYPENIRQIKLRQIYERFSSRMHHITSENFKYALHHFGISTDFQESTNNNNNTYYSNLQSRSSSHRSNHYHSTYQSSQRQNSTSQQHSSTNNQIIPLSHHLNNDNNNSNINLRLSEYLQSQIHSSPEISPIIPSSAFDQDSTSQIGQDSLTHYSLVATNV